MRFVQFQHPTRGRCLGVVHGKQIENIMERLPGATGVVTAFHMTQGAGQRLEPLLTAVLKETAAPTLDYAELLAAGQILAPVSEEPGVRILVSGTGLTHLGSVQQRDA